MRTIILKGTPLVKEVVSTGIVTPGDLIDLTAVHGNAGENQQAKFVLENEEIGKGVTDAYASGDTIRYGMFKSGEEVLARLADSQTIAAGDLLESDGNGQLRAQTTSAATSDLQRKALVGRALEAVTTSGAILPIKVEVA